MTIAVGHSHVGLLAGPADPAAAQPAAQALGDTAARLDALGTLAAAEDQAPFAGTRARLDALGALSSAAASPVSTDTAARLDAVARAWSAEAARQEAGPVASPLVGMPAVG